MDEYYGGFKLSYWNNNGRYEKQAQQIQKDVPASGHAENVAVELYRCSASRGGRGTGSTGSDRVPRRDGALLSGRGHTRKRDAGGAVLLLHRKPGDYSPELGTCRAPLDHTPGS